MFTGLASLAGAAALAVLPVAVDLDQAEPPSVIQLCAATSISEVDALLDGVASTGLVGSLQPLASLTVPDDADALTVKGDVTLDDVRTALDCAGDPAPTTTAAPTETAAPTTEAPSTSTGETPPLDNGGGSSSGGSGGGFSQLDEVPSLPAQTGGGPAE